MNRYSTLILAAFVLLLIPMLVSAGIISPDALLYLALAGTLYSETDRVSDWLKFEEDQRFSREAVTVLSGQVLKTGHVIGKKLVGAAAAAVAFAGNTGNGAMGAIVVSGSARRGVYKLIIVEPAANAGTFEVEGPDGKIIGRGTVAVAFSAGGLAFTLADGATDFIAGDGFDITVTGGGYKYLEHDPAGVDGSEQPVGLLLNAVDATAADTPGVAIVRMAIIGSSKITWKGGTTADQKAAALAKLEAVGIVARTQP